MDNKLRMASFFAGVGGIDLGFEQSKGFKTVYANEFDPYPVKTFELNFDIKVDCRDINEVKSSEVPDVDIVCGGFPCQAFSIAGYRKGFDDDKGRGILFFEMLRIIRDKKPRVVFFENVKNLVSHDKGNTFQVIIDALKREGYFLKHDILNAMECGNVPQNRERIYIVGFLSEEEARKFSFPKPIPLKKKYLTLLILKMKSMKSITTQKVNIKAIFMKSWMRLWMTKIPFTNGEGSMLEKTCQE